MYPSQYWRENKKWQHWIGKQGTVLAVTTVHTPAPEYEQLAPYQLALVEFSDVKKLFMIPPAQLVTVGQKVEVVLRKGGQTSPEAILEYQLKAIPVFEKP